jgi:hypothetical protein
MAEKTGYGNEVDKGAVGQLSPIPFTLGILAVASAMSKLAAQLGDPLREGGFNQAVVSGVVSPGQVGGPPGSNMGAPEGFVAGLGGLSASGLADLSSVVGGLPHDLAQAIGRNDPDAVLVVEGWTRTNRRRARWFGGKEPAPGSDDTGIMPAATALGGHLEDFDQDPLDHALALPRGKRRRGREDDAGRPARYG